MLPWILCFQALTRLEFLIVPKRLVFVLRVNHKLGKLGLLRAVNLVAQVRRVRAWNF